MYPPKVSQLLFTDYCDLAPRIGSDCKFTGKDRSAILPPYFIGRDLLEKEFATNVDRTVLWGNFLEFVSTVNAGPFSVDLIWIGGSFVTQKLSPSDIDATFFLNDPWGPRPSVERDKAVRANPWISDKNIVKEKYAIDLNVVFLNLPPVIVASHSAAMAALYTTRLDGRFLEKRGFVAIMGTDLRN